MQSCLRCEAIKRRIRLRCEVQQTDTAPELQGHKRRAYQIERKGIMILFSDSVTARRKQLESLKGLIQKRLEQAPDGSLSIKNMKQYTYYVQRMAPDRQEGYLDIDNEESRSVIMGLAQKSYDQKALRSIKEEMRLIAGLERHYQRNELEAVYEKMSPKRQELIMPVILPDGAYAERWQSLELQKKESPGPGNGFRTLRGELVRSKSEVFIADTLYQDDVKYHYECALTLIDHITGRPYRVHPDFLVLNARTHKEYYWEHFGRMDDPVYAQKCINKLIDYMNAGYYPGEQLIITFETEKAPLKPDQVRMIVEHYLH